ncbi:MAG: response regulator [Deltaproteobacteria bacterium]|nr:response regulator [Deltaproteobacteria bacterium]
MGTLKILIVEDDPVTLSLLAKRLRKEGFEVETTHDGDDALRRIAGEPFDVVLTDLLMPGETDGMGVLENIKRLYPHTEVILLTGYISVESAVEAMKKGATDFLTKPINFDELIIRLNKIDDMRALIKAATDLRNAMEVTEKSAADTIQELEIMLSEFRSAFSEVRDALTEPHTHSQDRIDKALNILQPLVN